MTASSRAVWPAVLVILSLVGSCGERQGDTSGAAGAGQSAPADTAGAAAPADTGAASLADTTQKLPAAPDSAAAAAQPDPPAPRESGSVAARDTAAKKPSPKPPPEPAPQQPAPVAQQPPDTTTAPNNAQAPPADAPLRDQYHQAPRDTVSQAVYDGWKQYNLNCARCHGEDVIGTTIAPHLVTSVKPNGPVNSKEVFVQTVCAGRPEKGMPGWCALGLEMDKIGAIYSYVKGRSDGKIRPGRPAVRQEG
ncbi:MAG: c-type cytochrome [Gemmatimonadales bacterium]